jgi:hypothetical protein
MKIIFQKIIIIFMLNFYLIIFSTQAQNNNISYFYSNLPPYEYINTHNQAAGIGIEHLKNIFSHANLSVNFQYYSIKIGINLLHQGKVDFASVISPDAKIYKTFIVSKRPIYNITLGVLRLENTPSINQITQLNKQPFATLKETTFLFNNLTKDLQQKNRYNVSDFNQGIFLVKAHKLPYFLIYEQPKKQIASTLTFDRLLKNPVHLIISKQHPQAKKLMDIINKSMNKHN